MALQAFKNSHLYRHYVRHSIWMPIRAQRWVFRSYAKLKRDRHLRNVAKEDTKLLAEVREEFGHLYKNRKNPLVSITVATYNRARLLTDIVLPAALAQTYRNIEIIVVGDHCTDETAELMGKVKDPRVTFYNLSERQRYPKNKLKQWKVSGLNAIKHAHSMARGLWIAHLDDDDVFTPDHVEKLLTHAIAHDCEFVSGRSRLELRPGQWIERGKFLRRNGAALEGYVTHSTVLRRAYTKFFTADRCLETDLAGDSYVWHRMLNAGVRTGFVDEVVTLLPLRPGEMERSLQYYFNQC